MWRHFKLGEDLFRMVGLALGVVLRVKILSKNGVLW